MKFIKNIVKIKPGEGKMVLTFFLFSFFLVAMGLVAKTAKDAYFLSRFEKSILPILADYWYVPFGTVRVVLHDLRSGSPTEGATQHTDLDGTQHRGIYIPPGVAHGFSTLTDATITYLVDNYYNPADELGVAWDDPEIGADWGLKDPTLSSRDQSNPLRNEINDAVRPHYGLRN